MFQQSHLVAGDTQRVTVTTLAQPWDSLAEGLLGLSTTLQRYQRCSPLGLANSHFVLSSQIALHVVGTSGIVERLLVLAHVVIHLRGHAVEHSHALGIIHLLGIRQGLQDIFLSLLGLAHRHIDSRQRVVTRRDHVSIATLQIEVVALLGVACGLLEMALPHVDDRQQIQQIAHSLLVLVSHLILVLVLAQGVKPLERLSLRLVVLLKRIETVGLVAQQRCRCRGIRTSLRPHADAHQQGQCHHRQSLRHKITNTIHRFIYYYKTAAKVSIYFHIIMKKWIKNNPFI